MSRRTRSVDSLIREDPNEVLKLTYRGNYADICSKLGHEEAEDCLTDDQRRLRDICRVQNFLDFSCRPAWAGGAHIFVTPTIASEIKDALEGQQLRKEHIIVSEVFRDIVVDLLQSPQPMERMRNRGSHQPRLRSEEPVPLAPLSFSGAAVARADVPQSERLLDPISYMLTADCGIIDIECVRASAAPSDSARLTHTTGSRPRSQPAAGRSYGPRRKAFVLRKVPAHIINPAHRSAQANSEPVFGAIGGGASTQEFSDARSIGTMLSFGASLQGDDVPKIVAEYVEQQAVTFERYAEFESRVRAGKHPSVDSCETDSWIFSSYVKATLDEWISINVRALLQVQPLEGKLANAAGSAGLSAEHTIIGQDWLANIVRASCSKEVFCTILHHDSEHSILHTAIASVATELDAELRSHFKKSNRKQQVKAKRLRVDGFHEAADHLQGMVMEAISEALSEIDVRSMCETHWRFAENQHGTDHTHGARSTVTMDAPTGRRTTRNDRVMKHRREHGNK